MTTPTDKSGTSADYTQSEGADNGVSVASGYVLADDGTYLVQVADPSSRWGFYLASADSSDDESPSTWDGGFGALSNGAEWKMLPTESVPADVQERLGWLLEGRLS